MSYRLSIRSRLLLNSALLILLLIALLAVNQSALHRVVASFVKTGEDTHLFYGGTLEINTLVAQAQMSMAKFALRREMDDADKARQGLDEIRELAADIRRHAEMDRHEEIFPLAQTLLQATAGLRPMLEQLISAQVTRGLDKDSGIIGRLRAVSHRLLLESAADHAVDSLLVDLLDLEELIHAGAAGAKVEREAMDRPLAGLGRQLKARVNPERHPEIYRHYEGLAEKGQEFARGRLGIAELAVPLRTLVDSLRQISVTNIEALLLQVRRFEKDYQLREDAASLANLEQILLAARQAFADSAIPAEEKAAAFQLLDSYQAEFARLVENDREIAALDVRLQQEAGKAQAAAEAILSASRLLVVREEQQAKAVAQSANRIALALCLLAVLVGVGVSLLINRSINRPLQILLNGLVALRQGDYQTRVRGLGRDEIGCLGEIFNQMAERIGLSQWLAVGRNQMAEQLREDKSEERLCRDLIVFLCRYLQAEVGAVYLKGRDGGLVLGGSYSACPGRQLPMAFKAGEGLAGEAVLGGRLRVIDNLPHDYLRLESGLGQAAPTSLLLMPLVWMNRGHGVIELAAFTPFSDNQRAFVEEVAEAIAIALASCQQRGEVLALLEETQRQAATLQTQQEELRASNEELEEQTQSLSQSEEELKGQQEELQAANEELEEKSESLTRQKMDIERKNRELEEAWRDIDGQARELAAASRYKSEFLANMSHELRTPLNSMLLLARNLAQNKAGNLREGQVESASIIYNSGQDLLRLINDILDLSKIEAGRMDVVSETIGLRALGDWLRANFAHLADDKGLSLTVAHDADLPQSIVSDRMRLEQILRNLVGNALKFTAQGGVTVRFERPAAEVSLATLSPAQTLAVVVQDTGIGISPEHQRVIFDAFTQAEGGTARQYGGTGLGLSISKKLVELLGGEIRLDSEKGRGSTFTIYLPLRRETATEAELSVRPTPPIPAEIANAPLPPPALADDRDAMGQDDKRLLIIEDDVTFAKIVMNQGRDKGFKCLVAVSGGEGLQLAKKYAPNAIVLDIVLPDIDGWQVLEALKSDAGLRHIPVHMMSGQERTLEAFKKGAIGFLCKPVSDEGLRGAFTRLEDATSTRMRDLLVVEDDATVRQGIADLIGNGDVLTTQVGSGAEAMLHLTAKRYDCMILDIGLPDMSGFDLLDRLKEEDVPIPPVIIYTGRELTREEGMALARYTSTVIIKGVKSEERLLDETALFLHRVVSKLPVEKRQMIASLYDQDNMFRGKKVLVVDDDMRNAFALSRILEERGMQILIANNGGHALEMLAKDPAMDLVLMDIMMPGMDGYETIRRIRDQERFWNLPIIALTAKAMPEDKEKCMAVGASDYLAKPVNEDRLLALLRVWLYR